MGNKTLILLAGGKSSRMATPKGLLFYKGRTWLEEQLERLIRCDVTKVFIVFGFGSEEYFKKLPWLNTSYKNLHLPVDLQPEYFQNKNATKSNANPIQYNVLVNPNPELGPFSSLKHALEFCKQELEDTFVLPIDVPCPKKEVWNLLLQSKKPSIKVCIPEYEKRRGHPVLLSKNFLSLLLEVSLVSLEHIGSVKEPKKTWPVQKMADERCPKRPDHSVQRSTLWGWLMRTTKQMAIFRQAHLQPNKAARLDYQIQMLPKEEVLVVPVLDPTILLNLNTIKDWESFIGDGPEDLQPEHYQDGNTTESNANPTQCYEDLPELSLLERLQPEFFWPRRQKKRVVDNR